MKIGILTFHTSINNGAVMQCKALSKRLQQEFPDETVEVIDYRMPKIDKFYEVSVKQYLANQSPVIKLKKLVHLLRDPGILQWQKKRRQVFQGVMHMLPLSGETICDDGVEKLFDYIDENYDVVVAGSDAIWNYVIRGFPNPYFLSESVKAKKFSYAASCYGMSYENIPEGEKEAIRKSLESYTFLGARDGESEKFLAHIGCAKQPVHTCDPTVFLDVNDLPVDEQQLKQKLIKKGFDFDRPAIGVMGTEKMVSMVKALYGKDYQIVALYNYCKEADVNLFDLTPYEWAWVFRCFKLTFTTYFHGTMLSLRNGTPVICIALETDYSKNHMTKVEDFLRRVGLESCYFSTDYKTKNIAQIKQKADELLSKDHKADICARMDKEALSSQPFFDAVRTALYGELKEEKK